MRSYSRIRIRDGTDQILVVREMEPLKNKRLTAGEDNVLQLGDLEAFERAALVIEALDFVERVVDLGEEVGEAAGLVLVVLVFDFGPLLAHHLAGSVDNQLEGFVVDLVDRVAVGARLRVAYVEVGSVARLDLHLGHRREAGVVQVEEELLHTKHGAAGVLDLLLDGVWKLSKGASLESRRSTSDTRLQASSWFGLSLWARRKKWRGPYSFFGEYKGNVNSCK
ncbi:hypothetical protein V8F06_001935 [Rhypophila decipiens]